MSQAAGKAVASSTPRSAAAKRPGGGGALRILLYRLLTLAVIFGGWELLVRTGAIDIYIYGQPSGIVSKGTALVGNGELWRHTSLTAIEAVSGFVLGSFIGSALGLALWLSPTLAAVLRPIIVAINGVPKIALAPLIIVWFGIGIEAKIAIAALLTFIVSLITTFNGTQQIDQDLVRLMRSLGASRLQTWTKVVIPASTPWVFSALRLNVGFALIGAVVGEYISAKEGLGYLVYYSGVLYDLNSVWVGIFALMVLALILDYVVSRLQEAFTW